jgi:hypothetical protein
MRVQTTWHTKQQPIKFLTFPSRQLLTPSTTCSGEAFQTNLVPMQKSYEFWLTCKTNYITCTPTITLVKLTQIHCFTSSGKICMTRLSVQHSPTLTHSKLLQSPLLMPNPVTSFGPCQMWLLRNRNKSLSTGRIQCIHTNTPKGSAIQQGLPHALCAEDQTGVLYTYFLGATTNSEKNAHKPTPPRCKPLWWRDQQRQAGLSNCYNGCL